jgi:hypothetical protein
VRSSGRDRWFAVIVVAAVLIVGAAALTALSGPRSCSDVGRTRTLTVAVEPLVRGTLSTLRVRLAQELRRKGIDEEVARDALGVIDESDEVDAARMLVRRKLRSVRGLGTDKAVRRLVGMLARKGHSSGVAFRVVREELGADLADPEHSGP